VSDHPVEESPPDDALVDLFRSELSKHAGAISSALRGLNSQGADWEKLRQHAHAIWGGACIVELEAVANLIQALAQTFVQAQTTPPSRSVMESMLRAATWLDALSGEQSARVAARVAQAGEELAHISALLREWCAVRPLDTEPLPDPAPSNVSASAHQNILLQAPSVTEHTEHEPIEPNEKYWNR